jgi:hypothetical protein
MYSLLWARGLLSGPSLKEFEFEGMFHHWKHLKERGLKKNQDVSLLTLTKESRNRNQIEEEGNRKASLVWRERSLCIQERGIQAINTKTMTPESLRV